MSYYVFYLLYVSFVFWDVFIHPTEAAKNGIRRGLVHNNLHYLDPPGEFNLTISKDEWFEQRLDHFNAQNTKTWKQRYFSRWVIEKNYFFTDKYNEQSEPGIKCIIHKYISALTFTKKVDQFSFKLEEKELLLLGFCTMVHGLNGQSSTMQHYLS